MAHIYIWWQNRISIRALASWSNESITSKRAVAQRSGRKACSQSRAAAHDEGTRRVFAGRLVDNVNESAKAQNAADQQVGVGFGVGVTVGVTVRLRVSRVVPTQRLALG